MGRTIKQTPMGMEWIHGDKYVTGMLREFGLSECKPVCTPVAREEQSLGDDRPDMPKAEASRFRRAVAKVNYLSQDRLDIALGSSLLARTMSRPREGDEQRLKRILRYLRAFPRAIIHFMWQPLEHSFDLMTDSDWATCKTTRKSTSGGILLRGRHLISHWSRIQGKIAPSSGEAELFSASTGLSVLAGAVNLDMELTGKSLTDYQLRHRVDASACRSMLIRRGAGAVKHLEVRDLWGQQMVRRLGVLVMKVPRAENTADLLASPGEVADFRAHLANLGVHLSVEEADSSLQSTMAYFLMPIAAAALRT